MKHMYRAGLVVLLLVDEAQASQITSKDENYVTEWDKYGQDVDDVARFICEYTAYQE